MTHGCNQFWWEMHGNGNLEQLVAWQTGAKYLGWDRSTIFKAYL